MSEINTPVQTSDDVAVDKVERSEDNLVTLLTNVLESRTKKTEQKFTQAIQALAVEPEPDQRELAGKVTDPEPKVVHTRSIVSLNQPRDYLYRRLYRSNPELQDCRTPDIDHWCHQWLLGLVMNNEGRVLEAYDKANAAYKGQFKRADTLEGAIDASDETAILGGTGGSLLPQPFSQVVMIAREATAKLRRLATVYPMGSATLRIPTASNATAAKLAEGGNPPADQEPLYASIMLKAEKLQCHMRASREFINDSAFNAVSLFGTRAGMAIGAQEDVDFATSDGVAPNCSGPIAGGDETANLGAPTVLTYEDLSTLYRSVPQAYRGPGCAWLAATDVMGLLDTLVDGNGRPILVNPGATVQPIGDSPGNEGQIFRHPVFEFPFANGVLLFGNIRMGYAIGDREGISARMSEHSQFTTGLVEFIFEERYDADQQDADAMSRFTGLASVA